MECRVEEVYTAQKVLHKWAGLKVPAGQVWFVPQALAIISVMGDLYLVVDQRSDKCVILLELILAILAESTPIG